MRDDDSDFPSSSPSPTKNSLQDLLWQGTRESPPFALDQSTVFVQDCPSSHRINRRFDCIYQFLDLAHLVLEKTVLILSLGPHNLPALDGYNETKDYHCLPYVDWPGCNTTDTKHPRISTATYHISNINSEIDISLIVIIHISALWNSQIVRTSGIQVQLSLPPSSHPTRIGSDRPSTTSPAHRSIASHRHRSVVVVLQTIHQLLERTQRVVCTRFAGVWFGEWQRRVESRRGGTRSSRSVDHAGLCRGDRNIDT